MSRKQDPVDEAIESIGGALIGLLIVGTIGYFLGRQQRNRQKDFELPDGLVMDYEDTTFIAPEKRPFWVKQFGLFAFYLVIGILFFGSLTVHYTLVASAASDAQSSLAWAIPGGLLCLYLLIQLIQQKRHYATIPSTCRANVDGLHKRTVQVYTVTLPKDSDWRPQDAGRFMQQLLYKTGRLIFQIVAKQNNISWRIIDWAGTVDASVMRQAIQAFYPDAEIVHSDYSEPEFSDTYYRLTRTVCQEQHFINPIAYISDFTKFDPLVNMVQEMDGLAAGEQIVYTLAITEPAQFVYQQARDVLTIKAPVNPFDVGSMAYAAGAQLDNRMSPYEEKDLMMYIAKLDNLVYQAVLYVQADAASEERAWDLLALTSHMAQYDRHLYNRLNLFEKPVSNASRWIRTGEQAQETDPLSLLHQWLTNMNMQWRNWRLLLDTQELAALWHLPHKEFKATNIVWTRGKKVQMPGAMRGQEDGVLIGYNRYAGQTTPVYLPEEDRATHMSVIGQTGVGKSTLLHNMIHADIQAGRGVAVIDPKAHLVRDILQTSIPPEREDDVVVLDVADLDYPPPLNLLAVPEGFEERSNAVEMLLAVFEKLYPDFGGTRMADTFSMAVQTLWKEGTPTLLDVERLFEDVTYRQRLVTLSDNFVVQRFWAQFESKTAAQQEELAQPILYRMRQFYGNRTLLPMMCHPEPLDLYQLVQQNKIILISLAISETKLPPREQHLLGAVLISQIQMAAMSGAIANPPFYLYVDEAQNFVTTSLPQMLTTARSSGLALVMANQHLKQLSGDTLDAVLGNVGAAVAFQCSEHDARVIARLRKGFEVDDLMQLDKYKAGVFMRYKGETQPAFSLETRPAPEATTKTDGETRERTLRQKSRSIYARRSREEIMNWLTQRYASGTTTASPDGRVEETFYD